MYLEKISNFIIDTNYESMPIEIYTPTKNAFIDTIGVTIAAEDEPASSIAKSVVPALFAQPEYETALKTALEGNAMTASFLLGTLSHVLDYDDVNFTFHGHPSVALIPMILALGKEENLTGKEMMEAYVIGFEVQARLGEALGVDQYLMGWHTTSTIGIYGAVAVASKILKLNKEQIMHAFGIASSLASGTRKNFGTMTKPLHVGFLAKNALTAVHLAANGATANTEFLKMPMSIDWIMGGQKADFSPIEKLGKEWEIIETGIIFKKYPCCAFTHRSIDATIALMNEHHLQAADIEKIEAAVHYKVPSVLIYPTPKDGFEGKFSMPFCLAKAAIDRKVDLATFSDEAVMDNQVQSLMKRVEMFIHPEQEKGSNPQEQFSEVTIHTAAKQYTKRVEYPLGHPKNPLSEQEIRQKFLDCSSSQLGQEKAEQLYQTLSDLESKTSKDVLDGFRISM